MSLVTIKKTLTKKFYYKNGQSMIEGKAKKNSMVTIQTTLSGNFDFK